MSKKSGHCILHGLPAGSRFERVWYLAADLSIRMGLRRRWASEPIDSPLHGVLCYSPACTRGFASAKWHVRCPQRIDVVFTGRHRTSGRSIDAS